MYNKVSKLCSGKGVLKAATIKCIHMSYVRHYTGEAIPQDFVLPFRLHINFKKLIAWWEEQAALANPFESARAREVLKRIEKTPQLRESFDSIEWIEKYQQEIQLLLSPFFPSLTSSNEIKAAGIPFKLLFFNLTKRFTAVVDAAESDIHLPVRNPELMYMFGCIAILNAYYGANINHSPILHFDIRNKKTGILRRYRAFFNTDFAEIVPLQQIESLTEKDIRELTCNFSDITLWKKKIPPESYSLEGFSIVTLFDVTREESVSALKFDLLKKDALLMPDIVDRIRINLCAMLNIPNVKPGFISYEKERGLLQAVGYGFWNSILLSDKKSKKIEDASNSSFYNSIFVNKQPYHLPELDENTAASDPVVKKLIQHKLKSYMAMPLLYNNELIGILELGSEQPNVLDSITVHKMQEVVVLFTTALKRSQDEKENQLEAIIRQKCTAIHPTVAWRFTQAAENLLESQRFYQNNSMEDIVFTDVYPLYGQADIQGSSTERNRSIQADLIEQLTLTKNVFDLALKTFALPVYKELRFRIEKYIEQLKQGLSAGDENIVLEFLKAEVYPVFNHLHTISPAMHEAVVAYEKQVDPALGMVYKQRKDYEQSVKLINEKISEYLDKTQVIAQEMFPHYFEKYKTDGVEHNLYIGQSMVNNKTFHPLYLQNLRLWQLLAVCEIENVIYRIKSKLKTKLDICSLILAHSNPLSIRFRMEEKKFDVDGTYNIRYEIIKKRIDKAYLKDTNERLTMPGKIAIVYSQDKEAREYMNYLQYLQSIQYIGPDIEWLTLNDLQGLTGLKALRADVVYNQSTEGIKESKTVQILEVAIGNGQ